MDDGLYKVSFKTPLGEGHGVVTLERGRISGGDSSMFYVGSFTQSGDDFHADVQVGTHSKMPGMHSVLGVNQGQIKLAGKVVGNGGTMRGSSPQAPGVSFSAAFSKITT